MRLLVIVLIIVGLFVAVSYVSDNVAWFVDQVREFAGHNPVTGDGGETNEVTYLEDLTYVPATSEINDSNLMITLYFSDENANWLIPVTRNIPKTQSIIRQTLTELFLGPDSATGLVASVPGLSLRDLNLRTDGTLRIDLPATAPAATSTWGSSGSMLAMNSILYTVGQYQKVTEVEFLAGGKTAGSLFHGVDTSAPVLVPRLRSTGNRVVVYLSYIASSTGRAYLVPLPLEVESDDMQRRISTAVSYLISGASKNGFSLEPTIPDDVQLVGVDVMNKKCYLNFDEGLLTAYADDPDRQALMIDSLVFTVTSFPEVDMVQFLVDGKVRNEAFGPINLGDPISRPKWINPER